MDEDLVCVLQDTVEEAHASITSLRDFIDERRREEEHRLRAHFERRDREREMKWLLYESQRGERKQPKPGVCIFWLKSVCNYGDSCVLAHE